MSLSQQTPSQQFPKSMFTAHDWRRRFAAKDCATTSSSAASLAEARLWSHSSIRMFRNKTKRCKWIISGLIMTCVSTNNMTNPETEVCILSPACSHIAWRDCHGIHSLPWAASRHRKAYELHACPYVNRVSTGNPCTISISRTVSHLLWIPLINMLVDFVSVCRAWVLSDKQCIMNNWCVCLRCAVSGIRLELMNSTIQHVVLWSYGFNCVN